MTEQAKAPVLIGDVVEADCAELRDIADWFERRGKDGSAEFLRKVATRHEVIFGAYWTRCGQVEAGDAPERIWIHHHDGDECPYFFAEGEQSDGWEPNVMYIRAGASERWKQPEEAE